jgi:hypothetical protein
VINIDLNRALHPRLVDLLVSLVPGLFFEICLLLRNPQWAKQLAGVAGSDHYYTAIFIALFLAFVIGAAFLMWVRLIERILGFFYRKASEHWPKVRAWRIKRAQEQYTEMLQEFRQKSETGKQQDAPKPPPGSTSLTKLQKNEHRQYELAEFEYKLKVAWARVAKILLARYGVRVAGGEYWQFNKQVWVPALGEARFEDWHGVPLVVCLQATGWSGLAATHFATSLFTPFFLAPCLFLVGFGMYHDYGLAKNLNDPVLAWILKLRRTLDELKSFDSGKGPREPDSGTGLDLSESDVSE